MLSWLGVGEPKKVLRNGARVLKLGSGWIKSVLGCKGHRTQPHRVNCKASVGRSLLCTRLSGNGTRLAHQIVSNTQKSTSLGWSVTNAEFQFIGTRHCHCCWSVTISERRCRRAASARILWPFSSCLEQGSRLGRPGAALRFALGSQ